MPLATTWEDEDLTYIVRETSPGSGVWEDKAIERVDLFPHLYPATVTIPSASVLTIFTTPILIVPAPPVGVTIMPWWFIVDFTNVTIPYATNVSGLFGTAAVTNTNYLALVTISASVNGRVLTFPQAPNTGGAMPSNSALYFRTAGGNPTAGDGTITIRTAYSLIS